MKLFLIATVLCPAELNRGDTSQDKNVKEAKSKCRTIASLLTDAPNPHSKGVLMFKKRRQRSKRYTLTSFGSVDEDRCQDSQEEDGVFPGSESEFDEDGFSAVPDPTWDSDYLDMLEKRATAGTEGRGDGAEDAVSPGLSDTAGKGAQLFEQQRKRAAEHAKKVEAAQPQAPQSGVQGQVQSQMQLNFQSQPIIPPSSTASQQELSQVPERVAAHDMPNGDLPYSAIRTACTMSPPPVAPKPATSSVTILTGPAPPVETPLPELCASSVQNRTARPFTPGFISIRAATAPVTFRPPIAKTTQRPASAAVVLPPFSTAPEITLNGTSVTSQVASGPPPVFHSSTIPQDLLTLTPEVPAAVHHPAISNSIEPMHSSPPPTVQHAPFTTMHSVCMPSLLLAPQPPMESAPVPLVSKISSAADPVATVPPSPMAAAQSPTPRVSIAPVGTVSVISQPEPVASTPVPGPTSRTGILLEARRRGGKPKPMFTVPDVVKKSPNPDLLSMVQKLDDRSTRQNHGQPQSEPVYDAEDGGKSYEAGMGRAPPVAPKPKVSHEVPQFLQAGGKGAELFARRQSRMGMYVVDTPSESHYQQEVTSHAAVQHLDSGSSPSFHSQWKYSPNVRAPPPISYNPLLTPTIPLGPQRESKPDNRGTGGSQREGIKALDFMRRQPYQLNSAMFNYGGSATNLSAMPSYQAQRQQQGDCTSPMVGSSLTSPRQIPIKTARVYEVKRFSTPTPMSAPTLAPKVIAPRSATTLGERLTHSDMTSPPPAPLTLTSTPFIGAAIASAASSASTLSQQAGLPSLPKFSSTPVPNHVPHAVPTPYTPVSFTTGLQTAKQFQSAPELSILATLPPLKSNPIQAPKPRFVATKGGVQPRVWRPGAM